MAFFVGKGPSDVDDDDDVDSSFIDPDIIFDGSHPFYGKSGSERQLIEISIEDLDTYVNNQKFLMALDKKDSPTIPSENANGNQNFRFRGVKNGGLEGMHGTSSMARGNTSDGGGHSLTMKHSPGGKMDTYQALHNNDEDGTFIEEAQRSLHAWEMNSLSYKEWSSRDWIGWNLGSAEYLGHALEWSSNEENEDISPYLVGIGHRPRTLKGRRGTSSMARGNTSDGGGNFHTMKHSLGGKTDTYQALRNNDEETQRSLDTWEMNVLSNKEECSSRDWRFEDFERALDWSSNEENEGISPYLVGVGHQPRPSTLSSEQKAKRRRKRKK